MIRLSLIAAALLALVVQAAAAPPLTAPPADDGLPILVRVGTAFVELSSFKENTGTFKGTVDVRLRWHDSRLALPQGRATDPPMVYLGAEARAQLAKIWVPKADIVNQRGRPDFTDYGLRIYPEGDVELIQRTTGEFAAPFDVGRFPFDTQSLQLQVAMRDIIADTATFRVDQSDLDFSRPDPKLSLDGWTVGTIDLVSKPLSGWHGASHAQIVATLAVTRQSQATAVAIFVPLLASLLIPFLALWLHRVEDGVFTIETFELVNVIIGGLFAVIALNFTVNAMFEVLGSGDNPVSRLFALNYLTLGASLLVNILICRFGAPERLFGRWVQEQLFLVLVWAIPLISLATAGAVIMVALA